MRPQIFWNVAVLMLVCLGVMHVRYRNFTIPSTMPIFQNFSSSPKISSYVYKEFCVFPDAIKAQQFDYDRITLVLHISYDRLGPSIIDQAKNWDGPISLAVVFPKNISLTASKMACNIQKLVNYSKESSEVVERLSAHFILEDKMKCDYNLFNIFDLSDMNYCADGNSSRVVKEDERGRIVRISRYPVNVARNIARKQAKTKYILVADMDHFFSKHFELKMRNLASTVLEKDPKTVLVYRIFEVNSKVPKYPETKEDLYKLYKKGYARNFHYQYVGHKIAKLDEWFTKEETSENTTSIQFYRKYDMHHWEPQFVSLTSIPFHDESFFYPLRDNTVLRWEMCRMSYKFAIINDVFMYHRGFKSKNEGLTVRKVRQLITKKANLAIQKFNKRMDKIYPTTKNTCPKFIA